MQETTYDKVYTWENTGFKGDTLSLNLLSAEIKFYNHVLNLSRIDNGEQLLTNDDKIKAQHFIDEVEHRLNVTLPMFGFNNTFVKQNQKCIQIIRKILNIKIIDS